MSKEIPFEKSSDMDEKIVPHIDGEVLEGRKFERKIEDFTCDNCETFVQGDGYTDHCPSCLYSKHVDINPGDRNNNCCGSMKSVAAEVRKDDYKIHYECEECGYKHRVKSVSEDNFDIILKLIGKPY